MRYIAKRFIKTRYNHLVKTCWMKLRYLVDLIIINCNIDLIEE